MQLFSHYFFFLPILPSLFHTSIISTNTPIKKANGKTYHCLIILDDLKRLINTIISHHKKHYYNQRKMVKEQCPKSYPNANAPKAKYIHIYNNINKIK